jgi:hypothetical protein
LIPALATCYKPQTANRKLQTLSLVDAACDCIFYAIPFYSRCTILSPVTYLDYIISNDGITQIIFGDKKRDLNLVRTHTNSHDNHSINIHIWSYLQHRDSSLSPSRNSLIDITFESGSVTLSQPELIRLTIAPVSQRPSHFLPSSEQIEHWFLTDQLHKLTYLDNLDNNFYNKY